VRAKQASGRAIENRFDRLQAAAIAGRLATVVCDVRGQVVDMRPGDRVWLYSAERDAGVFVVGRARRASATGKPTVSVTVERVRSRVLAADPLPAVTLRRWLPELRQAAVLLDLRPRALGVLDAWQRDRGVRDAELLEPVGVTPWRAQRLNRGHQPALDRVLGPIARMLRSQEFAIGVADNALGHPWLVGRRARDVLVVAAPDARTRGGRNEALATLGPLHEYRWRLKREAPEIRLRGALWIAFRARPNDDVVGFLEDERVLVSWQQRTGVAELTNRSKQLWYQHLGVR